MTASKVAVIGLSNIGQAVAANLAKGGHAFIASDRNIEKARELSEKWGSSVDSSDIPSALTAAQIVILCIPFGAVAGFMEQYSEELEGKIIVDPSNPIAADENGGFKKIIPQNESAGEINASALPKGAKLAKALGTLGAVSLRTAAYQDPEKNVLFYATDDNSINSYVEQLIHDNGFDPVHVGGLDQSIRIEVFGDLHEFGALGKVVTAANAKDKI
ncbi:NADPH-dependent F420 reductase [Sphingobacterium faecium]|uniref:NADPH-dependent F420 reductase n=1 Tax=Sphingobacterium faecium TaxID=34087 RepID=UPI003207BDD0